MGREAARRLLAEGHEVVTVSRTPTTDTIFRHRVCDRKNHIALETLLKEEKPRAILDMVCFDGNDGANMARLCGMGALDCVQHYLMVSTFFLYNYFEARESAFVGDLTSILDGYTFRKGEAEASIQSSMLFEKSSILRLPFVFSYDDYSGRFQRFCKMVQRGHITTLQDRPWQTSMICMHDAAQTIAAIVQSRPQGYLDASNLGCLTLAEISRIIARTLSVSIDFTGTDDPSTIYPLTRDLCLNSLKSSISRPLTEALIDETCKWQASVSGHTAC